MTRKLFFRIALYIIGLIILALGLVLNTKTGLGTSPLVSVAYCIAQLTPVSFADATFIIYSLFVLIEIVLHLLRNEKKALITDALQLPFSLVFSRILGFFDQMIPAFAEYTETAWSSLIVRVFLLLIAIFLIGCGACFSVRMRIIPNPGDGCVLAISDFTGRKLGICKNAFDLANILVAAMIGLLARGELLRIGIGTILAMIGVGRVIDLIAKSCKRLISGLID